MAGNQRYESTLNSALKSCQTSRLNQKFDGYKQQDWATTYNLSGFMYELKPLQIKKKSNKFKFKSLYGGVIMAMLVRGN